MSGCLSIMRAQEVLIMTTLLHTQSVANKTFEPWKFAALCNIWDDEVLNMVAGYYWQALADYYMA